ncbi:MAG: hypothetical protein ACRYFE_12245 [Janthinobacterium lividum]
MDNDSPRQQKSIRIYKDDYVDAHYIEQDSSTLVVSFAPRDRNPQIWGESAIIKTGASALGITDLSNSYYPQISLTNIRQIFGDIKSKYSNIITYGHSMGGYAALKYSSLFSANTCISFSPQYSIHPKDAAFDKRRIDLFYNKDIHQECTITIDDIQDTCSVVIYDPANSIDNKHAESILRLGAYAVRYYFTGHRSVVALTESKQGRALLDAAANHKFNVGLTRKIIKSSRLESETYLSNMFYWAIDRKSFNLAENILTKTRLSSHTIKKSILNFSKGERTLGDFYLRNALGDEIGNYEDWARLYNWVDRNTEQELQVLERKIAIEPRRIRDYLNGARATAKLGNVERSREFLLEAEVLAGNGARQWRDIASGYLRLHERHRAHMAIHKAIRYSPNDESIKSLKAKLERVAPIA